MLIVIVYDIDTKTTEGRRRLHKVAKICSDYGQRAQNSVYECDLDAMTFVLVKNKLLGVMNPKKDS